MARDSRGRFIGKNSRSITVELRQDQVTAALARLADGYDTTRLLDAAASLGEAQTRRRIAHDKRAPDGTPWAPWSDAYALTRGPGKSLLVDTQAMLDSIGADDAGLSRRRVGSPQSYAEEVHEDRPFVGVSSENEREFADLGERILRSDLEEAWAA